MAERLKDKNNSPRILEAVDQFVLAKRCEDQDYQNDIVLATYTLAYDMANKLSQTERDELTAILVRKKLIDE